MLTPYASGNTVVPGAVRMLGAIELDAGNLLDAATVQFDNLLATGAQSYEALSARCDRRAAQGHGARAAVLLARCGRRLRPGGAAEGCARIKAEQSGTEAGLAHLDELARSQPQLAPDVYSAKAGLLEYRGDTRRAAQVFEEGLARYPDSLELRLNRTFFLERTGKEDAAIRDLRALLAERPGDAQVQNALGYSLADRNRNLPEARQLITAALSQSPDNAAVLDSMGWLLFREGRYPEALDHLQRASKAGADPEIYLHVGEVQWAMGRRRRRARRGQGAGHGPENEKLRKQLERAGP